MLGTATLAQLAIDQFPVTVSTVPATIATFTLMDYEGEVTRLLHDPLNQAYSLTDIDNYINRARNKVALESQCCRTVISGGAISALTLVAGGSGYAGTATVTFTGGGGSQAQATATIASGQVTSITLVQAGWGYTSVPTVTVTGSISGTNAVVTPTLDTSVNTVTGQEVYNFSTWNTLATNQTVNPGFSSILGAISVACSQSGTYKPLLTPKIWTEFQAYLRIYQNTQQNYPVFWSQYRYGVNGSVYLYPWPAQALQMDVDVYCAVIPLTSSTTIDAITFPWTEAVCYYAAYLAYENSSRKEDADRMLQLYKTFMREDRAEVETPFVPDYYYGRND